MSTHPNKLLAAAVAAVAASGAASAQLQLASLDFEKQLVEQITELQAEGGPTPAALVEPLLDLGVLYQEAGDHALAIAALGEARHVTRVHHGLSSAEEALLLLPLIRSEEARGNHERVWNLQQDMVTIARQHLDDARMAAIFRELGDDRLDVLQRYHAGELPPELYLGCYYAAGLPRYDDTRGERRAAFEGNCASGGKSGAMERIRTEILMYYADAIEVIVRNGDYASRELRDLERQALRIGYTASYPLLPSVGNAVTTDGTFRRRQGRCVVAALEELLALEILGTCLQPVIHVDGIVLANVGSWVSLVRLLSYEVRSGAPAAARADAAAELADWLLFTTPVGRRRFAPESSRRALELYERLYRETRQHEELRASATQIFSPAIPVTLPTFVPNPFAAAAATASASRYVDVAFAVTKDGLAEHVEILSTSQNATRAEEKDVIKLIEGITFRPRVVDGELAASAPVSVRYHLSPESLERNRAGRLRLCERAGVCWR